MSCSCRTGALILLLCVGALLAQACGAGSEAPTQVLVVVDIESSLRETITQVKAEVYSLSGGPAVEERAFRAVNREPGSDEVRAPFSFGIVRSGAPRFLLVVTGYEEGTRDPVIEQKTIASFQEGKILRLPIFLSRACYQQTCASLTETCTPEGSGSGACSGVEEQTELRPVLAGEEISASRDGPHEADPDMGSPSAQPDAGESEPENEFDASSPGLDAGIADSAIRFDATTQADAAQASGADAAGETSVDAATVTVDDAGQVNCVAGQYVASEADAGTSRICAGCTSGTFSTQQNAASCRAWRNCDAGSYVANTPSVSEDRTCVACSQGTYTQTANQSTCLPPGACQAGTVQTAAGTTSSPPTCRTCVAGEYCAGGSASAVACGGSTWDHDQTPTSACAPRTDCVAGQYVAMAGNATSNRTCTACPSGTFSNQNNTASCRAWTACATDFAQGTAGSSTIDRSCILARARQFGTSDSDGNYDVAADRAGNVYVAGFTAGALPGQSRVGDTDAFLRKYDGAGNVLWTRQFGSSLYEEVRGVAVDSLGNVYAAGYTNGALPGQTAYGSWDCFIRKYSGAGAELWTRQFGTSERDTVYAVSVDRGDNVLVAGLAVLPLPGQPDTSDGEAFVRKYNSAGSELWTHQFSRPSAGWANSVSTDAAGNVLVSGAMVTASGNDAFVRKLNSVGAELWTRQFGAGAQDVAYVVRADPAGNVIIGGITDSTLPGQVPSGDIDAFVRKYDSAGSELWTRQFGSTSWDFVYGLAVDASANVYVAGDAGPFAGGATGPSGFVRRYSGAGVEQLTRRFGSPNANYVYSLSLDANGNACVGGWTNGTLPGQTNLGDVDAFVVTLAM